MARKESSWEWDATKEEAAALVAQGRLTIEEIAEKTDRARNTIVRWKRSPEFRARVEDLREEARSASTRTLISSVEDRVRAQDERWLAMRRIIAERGAAEGMRGVPGGTTGLLVHHVRTVGSGPAQTVVDEYELDAALLRELREHEKQAAQELGQWREKKELSGDPEKPLTATVVVLRGVTLEEI